MHQSDRNNSALPNTKPEVRLMTIHEEQAGQRLDNFLLRCLKGVPKSHIYRIVRGGEVRVNKKRVDNDYRLQLGDEVRIPPVRVATPSFAQKNFKLTAEMPRLEPCILYEDEVLIVLNKPAGMAVHGGSGLSRGVIEQLRAERPEAKFLELVHRLDRETSGVLLIAKKRQALNFLHDLLRDRDCDKHYLALVKGKWRSQKQHVRVPLLKYLTPDGERRVKVDPEGKTAHTEFHKKNVFTQSFSLIEAILHTGRTHQIRAHLNYLKYPIVGDDKYGDFELNKRIEKGLATPEKVLLPLKRMFLHAYQMTIEHPVTQRPMTFTAPLPQELKQFLAELTPLTF